MSVHHEKWITYAGNDEEALKCVILSRSLKASLTTRSMGVIISETVSRDMWFRLQSEFQHCYLVKSDAFESTLAFRSVAKLYSAQHFEKLNKVVFLDCNCVVIKNCDDLFRQCGVQWVRTFNGGQFAAIVVKSRSMAMANQDCITNLIVGLENGMECGGAEKCIPNNLEYCVEIDNESACGLPLLGTDLKMVCFTNEHWIPTDSKNEQPLKYSAPTVNGTLEREISRYLKLLCQETSGVYNPISDNELKNSIAIVGMACRYPGANTIEEFWTLLEQGLEGIRRVPDERWTKNRAFIRMDNVRKTEAGFLSCPVDTFDAKFFSTSPADMNFLDPQQRLAVRVVWEALEDSGINPNDLKNSLTGVFGGWWRNDYKEILQMQGIADLDFLRGYMGTGLGPLTARISHIFELIGPSFSTESGCSTSVAGVDMAFDSLQNEKCDLAIAVGVNLLLHPFLLNDSAMEGVLAGNGRCKTFDASADGFGRAEGVGVLVLKRFSNAIADGDKIWGLIRGSAVVQEGTSRSMGTPTVNVEARAMELALERSGVNPDDVEFVEAHGTGTPVGDPIEIQAISQAYSCHATGGRSSVLTIGSVKTNIGHTESVCGIASIQKALLSMKHELIPKHLNFTELNRDINLDTIPAQLPLEAVSWKRRNGGKPRIAGINSFGITGAQAHVIIQESPDNIGTAFSPKINLKDSRNLKLLTFSAKTEAALAAAIKQYDTLLENTGLSLKDIEFSMHTGRPHLPLRAVAMGINPDELRNSMKLIKPRQLPNMSPKLCFLFTGQGAQYHGMAQSLYQDSIVFRSNFDWCESILSQEYGLSSLKESLWSPDHSDLLKNTLYSQISIFVVELCLLKIWESWGVTPHAVLGHSLGEFAAAVAAGILSSKDALKLVVTRSKLINALPKSSMLVVAGNLLEVQDTMVTAFSAKMEWLDIAAVNSSSQTVLTGNTDTVRKFKTFCENNGTKTHLLDASHAFHSRLMDPMLDEYGKVLSTIQFSHPNKCTFISGVEGRVVSKLDADYWIRHTRDKVCFLDASHVAAKEGLNLFLEIGPHPILSQLILSNVEDIADVDIQVVTSLRKKVPDWETMITSLGELYLTGIPINWSNFHRYSGGLKVKLPGYHFEDYPFWMHLSNDGHTQFHPLLGAYVPNPTESTIFKNNLNVNRLPFLKDHALGDKIIFPCAGYLDMCMTAGYAATQCSEGNYVPPTATSLSIENFAILTPVSLSERQPTEFQVTVSNNAEGETITNIFSRYNMDENQFKWVKNATAKFSKCHSHPPIDLAIINFAAIRSRCEERAGKDFDYGDFVEYGFNFGPSLQVVKNAWKNSNEQSGEWLFQFQTHESAEDLDRFIIHPWVVDPMLQTQIFTVVSQNDIEHGAAIKKRLIVPVQIENFTWWGHSSGSGYVYVKNHSSSLDAHLFDDDGKLMASMIGIELMETTLSNIMSLIDSQKNPYPVLADIFWKEELGPEERRIPQMDLGSIDVAEYVRDEDFVAKMNSLDPEELVYFSGIHKLCELYMLKALQELLFEEILKETNKEEYFNWSEVGKKIGIAPGMMKFFRYVLSELSVEGWFEEMEESRFIKQETLPSTKRIQTEIEVLVEKLLNNGAGAEEIKMYTPFGNVLSQILTGSVDVLPMLYPEDGTTGPAEHYYTQSISAQKQLSLNAVVGDVFSKLANSGKKSIVRVLEVGAGVGSATRPLIRNMIQAGPSHFEYTFTDVSTIFLPKGEEIFANTEIQTKFALLNLENDPLIQGFIPNYYDVIVASLVLHATRNLQETVSHLTALLRHGGYVLIFELISPNRWTNLVFGGLNGFWRFEDTDIRPRNCELSLDNWRHLLKRNGFGDIVSLKFYAGDKALIVAKFDYDSIKPNLSLCKSDKWIVFLEDSWLSLEIVRRLQRYTSVVILSRVDKNDVRNVEDMLHFEMSPSNVKAKVVGILYLCGISPNLSTKEICEPFFHICKYLSKVQSPVKIVTLTRGNMSTGPSDFFQSPPHASPLIGMTNVLANENPEVICKCVDIDPNPNMDQNQVVEESISELFTTGIDTSVAYRQSQRLTPRLRSFKAKNSPLLIPQSSRYKLIVPASHMISDLQFVLFEAEPIGPTEVEIEVKAYALNFLDVCIVTKPDPVFEQYNHIGVDIAGQITAVGADSKRKVGERVILIRKSGLAMPSHLIADGRCVTSIPDDMTYSDAATLPMASATVEVCLVRVAQPNKEDVVLIHTASGGVGLCAVQMAQHFGCTIVVTAGNERKRNYLRSLGLKYVFNSRSTNYKQDIRNALGGRGVTVVLNSLTGEGYKEATLELCEHGARFVEMSKMNIWTEDQVRKLRPDVKYSIVDISTFSTEALIDLLVEFGYYLEGKKEFKLKPPPCTHFDASEIRNALEHMEKVRHIGKIVINMPERSKIGNELKFPIFNDRSTYLITGGLGGIGFEVAKWMTTSGAKNLILIGRSQPNLKAAEAINDLRENGVQIIVRQCDVGNFEELGQVFTDILNDTNFPPIRGIMHAAGILDDAMWGNQTWDKFENAFQAKVKGSWNLHRLSLELFHPLEHFVLFSTMAVPLGAVAQSNYTAGNQYLDSLAHYRYAQGLPATTINWGQWGQVGFAANLTIHVFQPFTTNKGLAALEYVIKKNRIQTAVYEATNLSSLKQILPAARGILADIEQEAQVVQEMDGDEFWREYDTATTSAERVSVIGTFLKRIIRTTLKMNNNEVIDDHTNFQDLGMDSLLMVEMKNGLQASVGKRVKISINVVKDCKTVNQLSHRLMELSSGKLEPLPSTPEQLRKLIIEDAKLPNNIKVDLSLFSTLAPLDQVENVLLLGVTGSVGSYILRELLKQQSIKKVICLIRHNPILSPMERFTRIMRDKHLLPEISMDRVEFVVGDTTKDNLGLDNTTYDKLAAEVDAVFNLTVKVSYLEVYGATEDPSSSRVSNVYSMRNILQFAVVEKLKYVYHASALSAAIQVGDDDLLAETWPSVEEIFMLPNSAYPISKIICDILAQQGVQRGIPCKVFRFPHVGGDSISHKNVQLDTMLMMRMLAYMYLGLMPAQSIPINMLPVDKCAQFSVDIFFNPESGYEMFNVLNPYPGDEQEFVNLAAELGIHVAAIDPSDFLAKIEEMQKGSGEGSKDDMLMFASMLNTYEAELHSLEDKEIPVYRSWLRGNKGVFWSKKLQRLLPSEYPAGIYHSWEHLRQDFQEAKKLGIFNRYKIV